jgi:aryl-alcohol dehydrogenase-like predicted oxidoreductase
MLTGVSFFMQTRKLGHSDLQVVPLMLGGNVFGWTIDAATSFAILDAFVDAGFNFIDTADVYSRWKPGNHGGESESIIGQWFTRSGKRDKVILATKVGMDMGDGKKGLARNYIIQAAEDSLKRLQTDVIDLYQSHSDDKSTPLDETLEAYQQLIQQGKVRVIGASNYKAPRLREAAEIAKRENLPAYQTLQPEYNLYDRQPYESELEPVAKELGLDVVPYFSLASGFLTGKYKTKEHTKGANRESRVQKYFDDRGMRILKALNEVAQETGAAEATISLAWLLAQPTILAPIASATSTKQLQSLLAAPSLKLSDEALKKLTDASA